MERPKPAPRGSRSKAEKRESLSGESHDLEDPVQEVNNERPERDGNPSQNPQSTHQSLHKIKPQQHQQRRRNQPQSSPLKGKPPSGRSSGNRNKENFSVEDDDDLDTSDFRRQVERLERDLSRRDRELEEERLENEKCLDRIKKLEKDKVELKREVEGFKDEAEEYQRALDDYKDRYSRSRNKGRSGGSDIEEQEDILNENTVPNNYYTSSGGSFDLALQQKNREIEQFMEDVEKLEDEKQSLKEKLTLLKDNLAEATKQIESMAQDHFNYKAKLQNADERIKQLQEENTVLSIKERDLIAFKERHEQYLENLCNAVDIRVDVWKKMMFEKDEEISRLNSKIANLMIHIPNTQMDNEKAAIHQMNQKIEERDYHIAVLNEKLSEATEEIDSNTQLIQSLQAKLAYTEDAEKTENLVKSLQLKLRKCEDRLERRARQLEGLEREADEKSKELTTLMSRMHLYESHQYGLSEAVTEIKDIKAQLRIRDKQVETVTQDINILQMQFNEYQEENEMLRDHIGLDEQADVSRDTKRYARNRKNELTALRSKVAQLEEEVIQLKTKNYSLKKQLNFYDASIQQEEFGGSVIPERERDRPDGGSVTGGSGPNYNNTPGDAVIKGLTGVGVMSDEWKDKYDIILEENSALRRGLHEILDCMHKMTDDGTADLMIQAPVLEELLREMSTRGIINYPFPITSFHMKVCNLEGKNSQLREEMHRLRQEEKQCRNELFEAQNMVKTLNTSIALALKQSVHRLEARASNLEEDRIRLEQTLEPKDSETMAKPIDQSPRISIETLSSTSVPLLTSSSSNMEFITRTKVFADMECQTEESGLVLDQGPPTRETDDQDLTHKIFKDKETLAETICADIECQTEESSLIADQRETNDQDLTLKILKDKQMLTEMMEQLQFKVSELEAGLKAKDDVINEIQFVKGQQEREQQRRTHNAENSADLQEAIVVARETINSLQERIKSKDDSVNQYRKLLAEVRSEMTTSTERHVQEMRALQMTIHQQQQAFTRMKSTLSQPVRDTLNVEGTIKDQLTRIHELEDEVSELQHAMGNLASQLTAARSEAHRWRCNADSRTKEVDSARAQGNMESLEEINSLRQELRETQRRLDEAHQQLASYKQGTRTDSLTELVTVLRNELDEKDKQIDLYAKSLHNLKNSARSVEKGVFEEEVHAKQKEIDGLKDEVKTLHRTVSNLQVQVSKTKAVNYKTGVTAELDELRNKHRDLLDEKAKLERDLGEVNKKRDEDELKKIKIAESVARWEESKKWTKNAEKSEGRIKGLELENDGMKRTMKNLRITIGRMEKEKNILEKRLASREASTAPTSGSDRFSDTSAQMSQAQQAHILAQGEISNLQNEIQDLKELVEKTEFEGREEAERLKMEVKLLKERIVSQERQLTAYQIAQKGDPKAIAEIESMAARESQLQKEIKRLEEDNLHLNLQIEQLRLDTPRLRDRVQHLQKLVDAVKAERPLTGPPISRNSQKSLNELEKTIQALRIVIEKLQHENKRLKVKPQGVQSSGSSGHLKTSVEGMLQEKQLLMDKLHNLEAENDKVKKRYHEASSLVEAIEARLIDAEKRAKSSEMKLRTFLGANQQGVHQNVQNPVEPSAAPQIAASTSSSYQTLVQTMRNMQEELDHKNQMLQSAKQSLLEAQRVTAPKTTTSSKSRSPSRKADQPSNSQNNRTDEIP